MGYPTAHQGTSRAVQGFPMVAVHQNRIEFANSVARRPTLKQRPKCLCIRTICPIQDHHMETTLWRPVSCYGGARWLLKYPAPSDPGPSRSSGVLVRYPIYRYPIYRCTDT